MTLNSTLDSLQTGKLTTTQDLGLPVGTEGVLCVEEPEGLVGPLDHRLLGGADPDPGVVVLLVGLVLALRVADLESQNKGQRPGNHSLAF